MKKLFLTIGIVFILSAVAYVLFQFCPLFCRGKTNHAVIDTRDSSQFTQKEIRQAADTVLRKFPDFIDCDLTELWYDEEKSNRTIESYMTSGKGSRNNVRKENVIVLFSNFNTGRLSGEDGFSPNSRYENWNWILIRENADSQWKIDDWGY